MNQILIGIFDEHKIVQEGISALLGNLEDIKVIEKINEKNDLMNNMKLKLINILIIDLHTFNTQVQNLLMQLTIRYPKLKLLIISVHNDEEFILKAIKAGAKGFLAKDTNKNELIEAIYTIRNGYDYFSKSITHLLLNKYISKIKGIDNDPANIISKLSSREIEILRYWGNSYSNQQIAEKLFISIRTVESHKNHIMQKLNLKTTVDLIKFAIKNNIIEI